MLHIKEYERYTVKQRNMDESSIKMSSDRNQRPMTKYILCNSTHMKDKN